MVIGADTGFFIKRSERNARTVEIWEQVILGQDFLVISVLTVAEFFAYQEEMVAQMHSLRILAFCLFL